MIDIKPLLDKVSDVDGARLKVLHNGAISAMRSYKDDPVERKLKGWQAAEEALKEEVSQLILQQNGGQEQVETFSTKLDVWRFLKEDGWKISRSQFYDHCKDGLLRPDRETGKYTLKAVEKYAGLHVRREETGAKINEKFDRMQEEKLETELAREKIRLEKDTHDLGIKQKKYIPRDEYELAVVGRAVALLAHLKHMVSADVPDWVDLVNGDQEKASELRQEIIEAIELRLSVFAKDVEFDVILEAD